jgi:hypothetical protein
MAWNWLSQVCAHALSLTQCMVRGCIWRAQQSSDMGPLWKLWCRCSAWTSSRAMSQLHCPLQPQVHQCCSPASLIYLLLPLTAHGHVDHLVLQAVTPRMLFFTFASICTQLVIEYSQHVGLDASVMLLMKQGMHCGSMMATLTCEDTQYELGLQDMGWTGYGPSCWAILRTRLLS